MISYTLEKISKEANKNERYNRNNNASSNNVYEQSNVGIH
jgi:hypothetical protein